MARGHSEIDGIPYKIFHWTPRFNEKNESPSSRLDLFGRNSTNLFQYSMLQSLGDDFSRFLKCDNATLCVTRSKVARICVEMDVPLPLKHHFLIGSLGLETSHYQEVMYQHVPAYCQWCRKQGHGKSM